MLWVRISIRGKCTTLCDKVCQWLATGRWFSMGTPVSSTNKTDRHDVTEILLKVALNTIKQTNKQKSNTNLYFCFVFRFNFSIWQFLKGLAEYRWNYKVLHFSSHKLSSNWFILPLHKNLDLHCWFKLRSCRSTESIDWLNDYYNNTPTLE